MVVGGQARGPQLALGQTGAETLRVRPRIGEETLRFEVKVRLRIIPMPLHNEVETGQHQGLRIEEGFLIPDKVEAKLQPIYGEECQWT